MAAPNDDLHVVFGTGPVGLAVMAALVAQGKRVRLVNRSGQVAAPAEVERVAAAVTDPGKDPPDLPGCCYGL